MIKVSIIGHREIKWNDSFATRAKGYLKAFKALGADADYYCLNKFHYQINNKETGFYYKAKKYNDVDLTFILSAHSNYVLSYFENFRMISMKSKCMVNNPEAFLNGKNKFLTGILLKKAGVAIPKTWMVTRSSWINVMDKLSYPVIIKKVIGSKGVGVMKFDSFSSLSSFFDYYFSGNNDPQGLIIQEYISESNATDFRVVVVNKKVILTMRRKGQNPKKNFRSNVAQGAIPSACKNDPVMSELAIKATEALGLFLSGVDIMKSKDGYKVLEVNSTPFIDVEQQISDQNLFKMIAKECLSLLTALPVNCKKY